MRSCARRSRDAATIFIALVICCVDLTARIRRRMSISDGIVTLACHARYAAAVFLRRGELLAELLQRLRSAPP